MMETIGWVKFTTGMWITTIIFMVLFVVSLYKNWPRED